MEPSLEAQLEMLRTELSALQRQVADRQAAHYAPLVEKERVVAALREEDRQLRERIESFEAEISEPRKSLVLQAARVARVCVAVEALFATAGAHLPLSIGLGLLALSGIVWSSRE